MRERDLSTVRSSCQSLMPIVAYGSRTTGFRGSTAFRTRSKKKKNSCRPVTLRRCLAITSRATSHRSKRAADGRRGTRTRRFLSPPPSLEYLSFGPSKISHVCISNHHLPRPPPRVSSSPPPPHPPRSINSFRPLNLRLRSEPAAGRRARPPDLVRHESRVVRPPILLFPSCLPRSSLPVICVRSRSRNLLDFRSPRMWLGCVAPVCCLYFTWGLIGCLLVGLTNF